MRFLTERFLLHTTALVALIGSADQTRGQVDVAIGADVFAKNCANQYCHGAAGAAGSAPSLVGRRLPPENVDSAIREGVADTSMPGWETTLSVEDLNAVIAYVVSLQATQSAGPAEDLDPDRPWLDHPGREAFFDLARIGPCGSCHRFDGLGQAVAPPIDSIPDTPSAMRELGSELVQTVRPASGDLFIGVKAEAPHGQRRWYDLTAKIPVLRSFESTEVLSEASGSWSHRNAAADYSDAELERILDFVRTAQPPASARLP